MFTKMREPVSGLTHFFAAIVAGFGLVALLIIGRGDSYKQLSLLIYGISLLLMFSASAAYHLIPGSPKLTLALRKLDHSAIYILIAGTYTPICLNQFSGFWRWGLLAIIWGLALAGVTGKIIMINAPRWLTAGLYLLMGWLSLMAIREMIIVLPVGALIWLFLGGVFFTIGATVYIMQIMNFVPGVFGFHEAWHVFVILGCLCHFIVIMAYIAPIPRVI